MISISIKGNKKTKEIFIKTRNKKDLKRNLIQTNKNNGNHIQRQFIFPRPLTKINFLLSDRQ